VCFPRPDRRYTLDPVDDVIGAVVGAVDSNRNSLSYTRTTWMLSCCLLGMPSLGGKRCFFPRSGSRFRGFVWLLVVAPFGGLGSRGLAARCFSRLGPASVGVCTSRAWHQSKPTPLKVSSFLRCLLYSQLCTHTVYTAPSLLCSKKQIAACLHHHLVR
jgi:hypothetical protein